MPTTLNKEKTIAVLQLHVRAQNKLKGRSLDLMRTALPNDEQYEMFKRLLKESEQAMRRGFAEGLVEAGIIEGYDPAELVRFK